METIVAGLALGLALFLAGLWLGERGRRKDAQRREGVLPVDRARRATVTVPARTDVDAPARAKATAHAQGERVRAVFEDLGVARQRYIDEGVREGFTPAEAAADWDRMMTHTRADALGVSPGAARE